MLLLCNYTIFTLYYSTIMEILPHYSQVGSTVMSYQQFLWCCCSYAAAAPSHSVRPCKCQNILYPPHHLLPARSLHPSAAAEEPHAFISLRFCSQAVRGNDISPHLHSQQHGLLKTSPVLSSAVSSPILHRQPKSCAPCSALT